jgi:hypothetical protein
MELHVDLEHTERTGCVVHDPSLRTSAAPLIFARGGSCTLAAILGGYGNWYCGGHTFLNRRMFADKARKVTIRSFGGKLRRLSEIRPEGLNRRALLVGESEPDISAGDRRRLSLVAEAQCQWSTEALL